MSKTKDKNLGPSTKAIHFGNEPCPVTGAVIPPLYQSTTFAQSSPGQHKGFDYGRCQNPTRLRLEECLASLEKTKYCVTTASGVSAMNLILHLLPKGSVILCGDDVYGGTYRLFTKVFQDIHQFIFVDTTDYKKVEKLLQTKKPRLLWLETPTNPLLKITDIEKVCSLAKKYKCQTIVDNTFATPLAQNPTELGVDFTLHSTTKYINGHSDVVGGAIMLNKKKEYEKLFFLQKSLGPSPSPFDSWLILRGVKTLPIRFERSSQNALKIANFLESHKKVQKVIYPGLKSHPQFKIAKKQMSSPGGMITFFLKGSLKESRNFLKSVKLFALAESLGGVESLIEHPAIMTHASVPKEVREELGIYDNLIRLSAGIENIEDLLNDLDRALTKI